MPKKRRMTRRKRKDLITAVIHHEGAPMRIVEIARAMNMSRSPYLVNMLAEMEKDGELNVWEIEVAPDLPARAYGLPEWPRVLRSDPVGVDNS